MLLLQEGGVVMAVVYTANHLVTEVWASAELSAVGRCAPPTLATSLKTITNNLYGDPYQRYVMVSVWQYHQCFEP